ncbi:MAG: hypothetical protein JF616_13825 [Fibrobacteres bacterium]|nr:hypothetical protein [Fibrobacterota bacterium]
MRFASCAACLAALLDCAATGSGKAGSRAAPADSIAIAYLPRKESRNPDYRTYRESEDVVSEIQSLDFVLRQNDFATEEIGAESFPALLGLGADSVLGKPSSRLRSLRALRYGPSRLLLVVYVPPREGGQASASTLAADFAHNAGEVIGSVGGGILHGMDFRHTVEVGRSFRAILYDKRQDRILLDTVSTLVTQGGRAPEQTDGETMVECHYRIFVQACLKAL